MRPIPVALSSQVAVAPVAFHADNVSAAIIQDRNRLRAVAVSRIATYPDSKPHIFEVTIFHAKQGRVLRRYKYAVRLPTDIGINPNSHYILHREVIPRNRVGDEVVGAGYIRILDHHSRRSGDCYRGCARIRAFPISRIGAPRGDGYGTAPLDIA